MTDGDEHTVQRHIGRAVVERRFDPNACYAAIVAQHFIQRVIVFEHDFAFRHFRHQTVDQNCFSPEFVAAVHYGDFRRNIG